MMALFDISLETANRFYSWGWRASIFGAAITAIAVILLMWGTRVRDRDFEENIAQLDTSAASSEERSKELEKGNLTLQSELEREKAARLKLEEKVKPRSISPEQEAILMTALAGRPRGPVFIVPDWMDAEAKLFAHQIETFLQKAEFPILELTSPDKPIAYGKLGTFLVVRDKNVQPPHLGVLYRAFRNAGFEFEVYEEKYVPDTDSVLIGVSTK